MGVLGVLAVATTQRGIRKDEGWINVTPAQNGDENYPYSCQGGESISISR